MDGQFVNEHCVRWRDGRRHIRYKPCMVRTPMKPLRPSPRHVKEPEPEIPAHRVDDRCNQAHGVDRPCPECGHPEMTWVPFCNGYWCAVCWGHTEMLC
jgi:hypothetical protein